jgi:predicted AlkP superfamily pyrophosphatase or phosphodiesterase
MRDRFLRSVLISFTLLGSAFAQARVATAANPPSPKLIVAIVIDQFRYDYLTRFRTDYHGGLDRMLANGADFTNAFYAQIPTVTAVGHSIFLSGAMPSVSGIIGNAWYSRDERQVVTSVCDWSTTIVGGAQPAKSSNCTDSDPASPKRLLVTTVGDQLKRVSPRSKVIGVSIKARAAILPSGHSAEAAFWLDEVSGNFVTSSYYIKALPAWAEQFNARKLPEQYVNRKWEGFSKWSFHAPPGSLAPYANLPAGPWGNELIESFAEQAITGEQLGQRDATDLLTVSFSSNDYVGHRVGPDAPEVRDMAVRTDDLLGKLFRLIDAKVGPGKTLVVLTADHGVASIPDRTEHVPGGYVAGDASKSVVSALDQAFGQQEWLIPGSGEASFYLNRDALKAAKVSEADVLRVARETIMSIPELHAARVYTRDELENGIAGDFIAAAAVNGFFPRRSGDLTIVSEPGYIPGTSGTTHFSPYNYDRHVPLLFMGFGIRPGRYDETVQPNDIAPTLATMLSIQTPDGSSGRVLTEALREP